MEKNWNSSWDGFKPGRWNRTSVNVRDFIQSNYTPYEGDDSFLAGPTEATKTLWAQVMDLSKQEREAGGVLDMDTKIVSSITSHAAGYSNALYNLTVVSVWLRTPAMKMDMKLTLKS